jgi:hypothetical protein
VGLREIQEFMVVVLQKPQPLASFEDLAKATPGIVAGNERLSPVEQLDIYREQFWLRHTGALEEDYRTLLHVMGHDAFHSLCADYLAAHPPDSFSLRDLGEKLPDFVSSAARYKDDDLVVDLARYEWAFVDAFDAPDAPPLDVAAIASASEDDWARAKIELAPSAQLVRARFPVDELRAAVQRDESPERPAPNDVFLVVWRGPDAMKYLDVEPAAYALLARLAAGESLSAACEAIAADEPAVEEKVGPWFQQWAAMGWIARVAF